MTRKEFLTMMGGGTGALILASCFGGCEKSYPSSNPTAVDFTLDLNASENAPLLTDGGYVYSTVFNIIIARTMTGTYVAIAKNCTHGGAPIQFQPATNDFVCLRHGATFNQKGTVTSGPATVSLVEYQTSLTGHLLRIYS